VNSVPNKFGVFSSNSRVSSNLKEALFQKVSCRLYAVLKKTCLELKERKTLKIFYLIFALKYLSMFSI